MSWFQKEITLPHKPRGFHLVTSEILQRVPEIRRFQVGLAHLFILHTSASLTINENADADVRHDMEAHFNVMVPENQAHYRHTLEGSDDMPAHLKASLLGSGLVIPISSGRLRLGTWQGIYLNEHRDHGGARKLVVTLFGE
ncbi:MAG: secondary thiamine-phosphate synthase enzyme YjbQ [Acidobacteriota bacterium]|nr:secondary thiamine-phosphate synthase enzyme YjbQ [Acidobacteriota bacterium]